MCKQAFILLCATALAGCNMAPKYIRPIPPTPPNYALAHQTGGQSAEMVGWEQFFGDPQLRAYLAAALANNRNLAAATARIAQAQAQFRIQNAARLPQLNGTANGTPTRTPLGSLGFGGALAGTGGASSITFNQYAVQVAISSFEIDF